VAFLDFGRSFSPDRRPVWDKILERIPVTLSLNLLSMLIILSLAVPIGVIAAYRAHSWFDKATTLLVFFGFAMPSFWLALLLILFFGVYLDWLPISGLRSLQFPQFTFWQKVQDLLAHVTLPVLGAAFMGLAGMSRYMRGSMLEVIRQDYITTARAKGLPERTVIFKHALRNALLPVVTMLGLSVPGLIGGSVIFERIFAIPGMGQLFWLAVMARDYPLVMGELVIGALLTLIGNLLADVSYALVDPRIRTG
jgi:peptide/nickel transport system permease protein